MRSISHLRHHSQTGVLHYRRVVPPELRPIIGKATISGTLGSKTLDHAALIRWVEIDRHAEQRLADARQKLAGQPFPEDQPDGGTPAFIDVRRCISAFEEWKQREIGRESQRLYDLYGRCDEDSLAAFKQAQVSARNALTNPDYQTAVAGFDQRLSASLLTVQIGVPVDHVIWSALRPLFRLAWLDAITVIDALTEALYGSVGSAMVGENVPPSAASAPRQQTDATILALAGRTQAIPNSPRLTQLVEAYLIHCEAEDDYATDLRMYARRLQESLGEDRCVRAITKRDLLGFSAEATRLPARLTVVERRMNLHDLLASIEAQSGVRNRARLSRKTLEKWFQCLGAMFRFGRLHDYCDIVPTEGIRHNRKRNAEPPRQHFEPAELRLIFESPLYQGHDGDAYRCKPGTIITRDAKYWLPQLALFTGCRRDEMVQARVADVKELDGIHFLHITTASDDGGRRKKVKTSGSRRMVPLHKAIINADFLGYVASLRDQRQMYLFPEIDQTRKEPAGSFGKWFDRFCNRLAEVNDLPLGSGIDAPTRTFHSFRHTFKRACRDA